MKVISTRGKAPAVEISECILNGLAPDGGLYMPCLWDESLKNFRTENFLEYAYQAIGPYFIDDPLESELSGFIERAFNFPLTLNFIENKKGILELFHGPTAAFKDFGARFLAEVLSQIGKSKGDLTILVATSGDTGGAVASAFFEKPGINVAILYPKGKVSPLQEKQLTCWGKNVKSFRVDGSFDDCQALVKAAFNDREMKEKYNLTSANSINLGRLLPQMAYQGFSAALFKNKTGLKPNLVIPTGNLGNAFGAFWAKKIGAPIEKIVMATNENNTIEKYFENGQYLPKKSVQTLANAMDVGAPSNMERLIALHPDLDKLKELALSLSVSDEQIKNEIGRFYKTFHTPICPHTAVGTYAAERLFPHGPYLVSSTAHPSKFKEIVEPEIGTSLMLPPKLSSLIGKEEFVQDIDVNLEVLAKYL